MVFAFDGLNSWDHAAATFASLAVCVCPKRLTKRLGYAVGRVHPAASVVEDVELLLEPLPLVLEVLDTCTVLDDEGGLDTVTVLDVVRVVDVVTVFDVVTTPPSLNVVVLVNTVVPVDTLVPITTVFPEFVLELLLDVPLPPHDVSPLVVLPQAVTAILSASAPNPAVRSTWVPTASRSRPGVRSGLCSIA